MGNMNRSDRVIAVIGLGYVGLPVAVSFAQAGYEVIGFDIDAGRIAELVNGHDRTGEVLPDDISHASLTYSSEDESLSRADFFIVTVPTPIDEAKRPDLGALKAASRTVGRALGKGDIVVYESTVYPGATEEECLPVLEAVSGLKGGVDFKLGYSPERINPGDRAHRFESIKKVVSGEDRETLEIISRIYASVVTAGVYEAPDIITAEAAKVIENTQRDLNIAFMNELSLIFSRLGIDTHDVLAAAGTKWNFLPFKPGLVGGHCIGVDPYYLTYKAERLGYQPDVILSGRRVNDGMGRHIARQCIRHFMQSKISHPVVTVLGLTFKEDVPDIRNSKVVDVIDELVDFDVAVQTHDPHADAQEVAEVFGISLVSRTELQPADVVIVAVSHFEYQTFGWEGVRHLLKDGRGVVMDVKAMLPRENMPEDIILWRP